MKIHHATVKWATDRGIALSTEDDMFVATKGKSRWTWTDAKTAARACAFDALIKSDYPSLLLRYESPNWLVECRNEEGAWVRVWDGTEPPEVADLEDVAQACDEEGLDPEAGYEEPDEDRASGSVVSPHYKVIYAERGDATNCGDWLAKTLKALVPNKVVDGKLVIDVDILNNVFALNGVESLGSKWGRAYHDANFRSNGWEGRFSMSGRNILRKRVADAGFLSFFEEKHMAPAEWCEEHRTAPKKAKKAKSTDEQNPATDAGAENEAA